MFTESGLYKAIMDSAEKVFDIQSCLCALPALAPENGGQGEQEKALYIGQKLSSFGIEFVGCDCPDSRIPAGVRPNLIAGIPGKSDRCLWLFGHMDVVPPGDQDAWQTNPWQASRDGDFIVGRGVEDNQQAIASMLILADCLMKCGIKPDLSLGLVFMADEECGSSYGMRHILERSAHLFKQDDLFIVPDGGSPTGAEIEIAEKAQLWLKFTVTGKQAHASAPQHGKNAFVVASQLVLALQSLYMFFPGRNALFDPPISTFAATRHEENVPAINILPGKDVFYLDCRLLPELAPGLVLEKVESIVREVSAQSGLSIQFECVQSQPATAVPATSPVMAMLKNAIREIYGVNPKPVGIGGATVAAFLREKGFPAVVWSCIQGTCHQPGERSSIQATLMDAAVFGRMLFD